MKSLLACFIALTISIQIHAQKLSVVRIKTPYGKIFFSLSDETPLHKNSFIQLVKKGYFNSYTFNRVIPNFVIQGGCPDTPEGFTDTSMLLAPEFEPGLKHIYGAVGAGRDDNPQMNSARCQFYIVQDRNGISRLDGKYTVFGQVIKGMDVVDKIVNVKRDSTDEPLVKIPLKVSVVFLSAKRAKAYNGKSIQ